MVSRAFALLSIVWEHKWMIPPNMDMSNIIAMKTINSCICKKAKSLSISTMFLMYIHQATSCS